MAPRDELDGGVWLRQQIEYGGPIVWSGYGLSLAVAEALAAVSRELGAVSYALNPADLSEGGSEALVYLSRSGRDPGRPVDLLVTQATNVAACAASRVLRIEDPDRGLDPWLPAGYARATAREVLAASGHPPEDPIEPRPRFELDDSEARLVLLFESHSRVIRSTLRAVKEKIGAAPCEAMTFAEIGHGFHSQLWARPEEHAVWILQSARQPGDPELAVRGWCKEVGVPVRDLSLPKSGSGALEVIQLFETALTLFEGFARRNGLPLDRAPIPARFDCLRFG